METERISFPKDKVIAGARA
jgi:hypothetical protein